MQNNKGFTLVEIMVAGLLVSVMTLAITSVMISNQTNFNNFESSQDSINELNRLNYYVNKYFSQAINIKFNSAGNTDSYDELDNTSDDPSIGHAGGVILYDSTKLINGATRAMTATANSGVNSNVELMAISLMENAKSAINGVDSEFAAIAMYFQRPTPQTYGQVFIQKAIDISSSKIELGPGRNDTKQTALTFERIVEAHVLKVYPEDFDNAPNFQPSNGADITAMDLKFVARSFVDANSDNWHWCPAAFMSAGSSTCPPITVNDQELFVTVTFKNNLIQSTTSTNLINTKIPSSGVIGNRDGTRPLGPIYFFQTNLFPKE